MSTEFTPWELETEWLIHSSVKSSVPSGDMGNFVCDAVREAMDLEPLLDAFDDDSKPPHYPAMIAALLIYAYRQEIFSSRRIAEACTRQVDFMALTAVSRLRADELVAFVADYEALLKPLFVRFLRLSKALGLPLPAGLDDAPDEERTSLSFGSAHEALEAVAQRWLDRARLADEEDAARGRVDDSALPSWFDDERKRLRKLSAAVSTLEREDLAREEATRLLAEDDEAPDESEDLDDAPLGPDDAPLDYDDTAMDAETEERRRPRHLSTRAQRAAGRRTIERSATARPHGGDPERRPVGEDGDATAASRRARPGRAERATPSTSTGRPRPKTTARPRGRTSEPAHQPAANEHADLPGHAAHSRPSNRRRPALSQLRTEAAKARPRAELSSSRPSKGSQKTRDAESLEPDTRMMLVRVVVAAAIADGEVSRVEQRRIDQGIRALRLDDRQRMEVQAMLRSGKTPHLPTPAELPDYDLRLTMFQQAAIMALADGEIHPKERQFLRRLAQRFELEIEDAKDALRAANQATGN